MKSVLSATLVAVALGSLAACSGSGDDENIASDVPTSSAADTTGEATTTTTTPPTTSASTTVPATTTPPDVGTAANPNPLGSTGEVGGGWSAAINSVVPDATALVIEENQFNDPPAPGTVYMLVSVTATNNGPGESKAGDIIFTLLGPSMLVEYPASVVLPEPEFPSGSPENQWPLEDVPAGGSVTGNIAFRVPAGADLSTYVVIGAAYPSSDDAESYFALL